MNLEKKARKSPGQTDPISLISDPQKTPDEGAAYRVPHKKSTEEPRSFSHLNYNRQRNKCQRNDLMLVHDLSLKNIF